MKRAILIVTWSGTTHYCLNLLRTLEDYKEYPLIVAINDVENCKDEKFLAYLNTHDIEVLPIEGNRWEMGALTAITALTSYDEFILIQDTLEVRNPSIFKTMFDFEDRSVSFGPGWLCYLGKYRRQVLNQVMIPICLTKVDAFYQEVRFGALYDIVANVVEGQSPVILFPEWGNDNPLNWTDDMFGRRNLVLDNPYLIKRKGIEWYGMGPFAASIAHI